MSWQNTSLIMLRTMLNDAGCDGNNTYSTQRLEDLLITSAYFLPIDINFNSSYAVDVAASIQTGGYGAQLAVLLNEGPCKSFEELKKAYNFSYEGKKIIRAVMSPFVSNDYIPTDSSDDRYQYPETDTRL